MCRQVYNKTLEVRKKSYESAGVSLTLYDTKKLLPSWKKENPEWLAVYASILQDVHKRVDIAFQAFFRRVKGGGSPGYPRFKTQGGYKSFTYPQFRAGFEVGEGYLLLPKIGRVRLLLHRPIIGVIKAVTIKRDSLDNWYVYFSCEVEPEPLSTSAEVVGVDLGLKTFATLSTGEQIKRQRWMQRDEKDIARLQRKKEQYPLDSVERRKVVKALNHAYQRSNNRRDNFAHQESRKLVDRFGLIVFEKLDIQGLQSNGNRIINRGIADVAWGRFVQYSAYKAESAGRAVVQVNPRGTTQQCSGCGEVVPKDLSVRVHDCPHCGLKIDRDLNAALNILARGLTSIESDS